ncbi:MAG TPA: hypothetical protein VEB64_05475 [Azospirillaceae bacterium]|nr:hypothetical protein [Azospirillaceae bacterium]
MVLIKEFAAADEELELLWLAGLRRDAGLGWRVRAVTLGVRSREVRGRALPIGLLPLLAPGRRFVDGELAETVARGTIDQLTIADVAAGQEVTSACIPPSLYSFEGHRGGVQRLLRYQVGDLTCLIPTIELVRFLFLHNKTLANFLMHAGGIMELCCPEPLGFHPTLHLRFTDQMPVRCLTKAFVREFAWLAVDPEGRRSWDSVYERTVGQKHVSFQPPRLLDSVWTARLVRWQRMVLILELLHVTGKRLPCRQLRCSHPSFRKAARGSMGEDRPAAERSSGGDGTKEGGDDHGEGCDYVVDTEAGGSRRDIRQSALHAPGKAGTFDRDVPVRKVESSEPKPRRAATRRFKVAAGNGMPKKKRKRKVASVSEPGLKAELPPVEFQMLQPVGSDYLGGLEPLIKVIGIMAEKLPDVSIATSLCPLKAGRAFSMAGQNRRVYLVAVFTPAIGHPVLLLDVDHSGDHALSALMVKFRQPQTLAQIEGLARTLTDGLVDNGGHWDFAHLDFFAELCAYTKMPKVLRRRERADQKNYLTQWATRLRERMGLIDAGLLTGTPFRPTAEIVRP